MIDANGKLTVEGTGEFADSNVSFYGMIIDFLWTYKMICVTQNGLPIIYDDLDKDPETITVKTNKFYAYALIYK